MNWSLCIFQLMLKENTFKEREANQKLPRGCLVPVQDYFQLSFRHCSKNRIVGAASHDGELSSHHNLHHSCSGI